MLNDFQFKYLNKLWREERWKEITFIWSPERNEVKCLGTTIIAQLKNYSKVTTQKNHQLNTQKNQLL